MINERIFLGRPISFKGKFDIYPPKVDDGLDNKDFAIFKQLLTTSQEEIEDEIVGDPDNYLTMDPDTIIPTPFEYLIMACNTYPEILTKVKEAFKFFIHQDVSILAEQRKILIGGIEEAMVNKTPLEQLVYIDGEKDFFDFQNTIRLVCGEDSVDPPIINENPRIKRIKAKGRKRDRIKAQKNGGFTYGANLVGICCMGIGITPLNIGQLSIAATRILTTALQKKEKYELDIQSLLAGADSKKVKPVYWLTDLNND